MAQTVTYVKRLTDVLSVVDGDFRVQVVFTVPPHTFGDEVPALLARMGCAVIPWEEAMAMDFDLALAAGRIGAGAIRAPLVTMPHGAAYLKRVLGTSDPGVAGLRRVDLVAAGKLPAAVVLPHRADLRDLRRQCPEAVPLARVVGDPVHDRIVASLPLRPRFRRALGLTGRRKLVVAASTWGPWSSFSRFEALLPRLLGELPRESHRVAILVHPNVYAGHGAYQVRSWMARCRQAGIALVPPEVDWRSVLVAADVVIGDHGSVTVYGTLTKAALLLAGPAAEEINPASPAAALARTVPALSPGHPLVDQLAYAAAERRDAERAAIAARITSEPGRFRRNMRTLLYQFLGLGEPAHAALTEPLPVPPPWQVLVGGPDRRSA
ncbi:hypothetical protein [Streptomyces sp. NPDC020983]|uniref:hypothetical protein n=1 Tax=Streptomyces sp. NPDC020983 TaxID=3365106 RepID=UPI0037B09D69